MKNRRIFKYIVQDNDPKNIRKFLSHKNFSESQLHKIRNKDGRVYVNKKERHLNFAIKSGDVLSVVMSSEIGSDLIVPIHADLDVIYEDQYLLIINKKPGIASLPSKNRESYTVANIVKYYLQENHQDDSIHLVTRLDRNTSGLMVFAKDSYTHSRLDQILHSDKFQKYYYAIVYGVMNPLSGVINKPIGIDPDYYYRRCIDAENGKESKTAYRTIKDYGEYSLIELQLYTGRTHQIRVHTSSVGHPIIGDNMYSGKKDELIDRQALHCAKLKIFHPMKDIWLELEAPMPYDMQRVLNELGG
ncbi:RluA family pseudouridine synthase [Lactobacillus terrae]|uniref:RluA family pseudouridine synthase n=1 Tax=Lactobacillus terrae TaxID=2269374 RepID=UPI000C1B79AC|nr:RluA family pseudouridine synthase [Lactobacillus terrae]